MGKEPRLRGGPDTRSSPARHCEAPAGEAEPTAPQPRGGAKGEVRREAASAADDGHSGRGGGE